MPHTVPEQVDEGPDGADRCEDVQPVGHLVDLTGDGAAHRGRQRRRVPSRSSGLLAVERRHSATPVAWNTRALWSRFARPIASAIFLDILGFPEIALEAVILPGRPFPSSARGR